MSATHTTLDAAATDRKARLAKLASLKRKHPGSDITVERDAPTEDEQHSDSRTDVYLSGRNYDIEAKGPRLGFENVPSSTVETIEQKAQAINLAAKEQAAKDEEEAEKGIDLFKLQPKKRNWDLKRDLEEKMKVVNVRTQNAIARLVRERIENAKKAALQNTKPQPTTDTIEGEEVGIEGTALVEGIHLREREEQEDEKKECELEDEEEEGIP